MSEHFLLADVLASGVHDVKNLLFRAESQLLEAEMNPAEARAMINAASVRLNNMLSAYHLLRHEVRLSLNMVNVPNLIEDAVLLARAACPRLIEVSTTMNFGEDWLLSREEISDLLVNALQNADRYARSKIEIHATVEDRMLMIEIHDDGPGFPANLEIGKPDSKGHGIGLFIAQQIAMHHQRKLGDHWVSGEVRLGRSSVLGGALFALKLP